MKMSSNYDQSGTEPFLSFSRKHHEHSNPLLFLVLACNLLVADITCQWPAGSIVWFWAYIPFLILGLYVVLSN